MALIDKIPFLASRAVKSDSSIINLADKIDEIHAALVTNKNAGVQLTGSNAIEKIELTGGSTQTVTAGATCYWPLDAFQPSTIDKIAVEYATPTQQTTFSKEILLVYYCEAVTNVSVGSVSLLNQSSGWGGISTVWADVVKGTNVKIGFKNNDTIDRLVRVWVYIRRKKS